MQVHFVHGHVLNTVVMLEGDPLSPTIFNVVVDAVVRHWVSWKRQRQRGKRDGRADTSRHFSTPMTAWL